LNRLDSHSLSLSLSCRFSPHATFLLLQLDPLQFGSHKLAAIHLALVLKRASRLVGRHEIKSPLSLSLSLLPSLATRRAPLFTVPTAFLPAVSSLFQPDSSAHIRLGLKDRTYLERGENTYTTRGERERVWEQF